MTYFKVYHHKDGCISYNLGLGAPKLIQKALHTKRATSIVECVSFSRLTLRHQLPHFTLLVLFFTSASEGCGCIYTSFS